MTVTRSARQRQLGLCLALLVCLAPTTGCTFIGAGIGAATSHTERIKVAPDTPMPATGEEIRVLTAKTGSPDEWIEGRYRGVREGALIMSTETGERAVSFDAVRELRVVRGSEVGAGAAAGAALDLFVVFLAYESTRDLHYK